MRHFRKFAVFLLLVTAAAAQLKTSKEQAHSSAQDSVNASAEDISGMYSFLKEGDFLQINLGDNGVSGYISREGDQESDRGQFLDQFFNKAAIRGHDVSFVTKAVHGVWFEFKGKFERGPAKTKSEDEFYILRGTLTEFRSDSSKQTTSHSREVEFKWLAQPE